MNDPTSFPSPSRVHGSYHWAFERLLSAGLIPLTVAAFVTSTTAHPILDGLLGVSLVIHSHIGVSSSFGTALLWIWTCCCDRSLTLRLSIISTPVNSPFSVQLVHGRCERPPLPPLLVSISSTRMTSVCLIWSFFRHAASLIWDIIIGLTELISRVWTA